MSRSGSQSPEDGLNGKCHVWKNVLQLFLKVAFHRLIKQYFGDMIFTDLCHFYETHVAYEVEKLPKKPGIG